MEDLPNSASLKLQPVLLLLWLLLLLLLFSMISYFLESNKGLQDNSIELILFLSQKNMWIIQLKFYTGRCDFLTWRIISPGNAVQISMKTFAAPKKAVALETLLVDS